MIYILLITTIAIFVNFSLDCNCKKKISLNSKLSYGNLLSLRGLLSLVIIYHHLIVCCTLNIQHGMITTLLSHMGYLCVAVFLFLSGLGLEFQSNSKGKAYLYSLPSKIKFLLLVFLYINATYFLLSPLYSTYTESFKSLYLGIISGTFISGPSWYLVNLIVLYGLYYFSKKHRHFLIILLGGGICLNLLYICLDYPAIWGISNMSFYIGILSAQYITKKDIVISHWLILLLSICLFVVFTAISLLPEFNRENWKYICQLLSTPFFSILIILLYMLVEPKRNLFNFFGRYSLEIFLIHVLIYKILRGNYIQVDNDFVFIGLTVLISVTISIPMNYINKLISKYIK